MNEINVDKMNQFVISADDIAEAFGCDLVEDLRKYILGLDLCYELLSEEESAAVVLSCFDILLNGELRTAGKQRREEWVAGWGQNILAFERDPQATSLRPLYFGKHREVRWRQQFIRPSSQSFEASMLSIIVRWAAYKYLQNVDHIAEFGCGTGNNLVDLRAINSSARLIGLDWASSSQILVEAYSKSTCDQDLIARNFDFFNPDQSFDLGRNTAVLTVAALEQLGQNFLSFLDYLLVKKPAICINIEPIAELLDSSNVLDFISIEYFKKRNYLSGFLPELKRRARLGELVIHHEMRTYSGSLFIEGHSIVVWSPC